jgi:16S rRNA processing protein RimM
MPASELLVPIGEIVTTHGLDGWLKFNPFNPETTALTSAQCLFLERDGLRSSHELESSKPYKTQFLIKLRDVNGIAAAEKWVGSTVHVQEDSLDSLKPGEYYHYQAIGLEVFDVKGDRIGVITRTCSTPGADLYVVQGATKEHLIPAVKDIIEKVDFGSGRMIINPPEGLLDL